MGAGPAGLAAALAASESSARVILADEQAEMGGGLLHDTVSVIDGMPAAAWITETLKTLAGRANVTLLPRTTAFGYYNHNHIVLAERPTDHMARPAKSLPRERLWQVRAKEAVLASGAHERPLAFPDNECWRSFAPYVHAFLIDAAQEFSRARRDADSPGRTCKAAGEAGRDDG